MIENTLVAFRIPVPMLDKIKAYCDETDQSVSQVLRRCAAQNFRSDADPRPLPEHKVNDGWAAHR